MIYKKLTIEEERKLAKLAREHTQRFTDCVRINMRKQRKTFDEAVKIANTRSETEVSVGSKIHTKVKPDYENPSPGTV